MSVIRVSEYGWLSLNPLWHGRLALLLNVLHWFWSKKTYLKNPSTQCVVYSFYHLFFLMVLSLFLMMFVECLEYKGDVEEDVGEPNGEIRKITFKYSALLFVIKYTWWMTDSVSIANGCFIQINKGMLVWIFIHINFS